MPRSIFDRAEDSNTTTVRHQHSFEFSFDCDDNSTLTATVVGFFLLVGLLIVTVGVSHSSYSKTVQVCMSQLPQLEKTSSSNSNMPVDPRRCYYRGGD